MKSNLKKMLNSLTTIIVVMVVILAIMLVGVRLFGLQVFSVLSGSMEPEYPVGSLIYVKKVDYKELKVGDPITFLLDKDTVATHRIIEVLIDEEDPSTIRYFTQGDANGIPDAKSVHYKNIIGTPVFMIPYMGYVSNYIQNPPGMYVAISAGAILLLLVFLPDLFSDDKGSKKKPTHEKEEPSHHS